MQRKSSLRARKLYFSTIAFLQGLLISTPTFGLAATSAVSLAVQGTLPSDSIVALSLMIGITASFEGLIDMVSAIKEIAPQFADVLEFLRPVAQSETQKAKRNPGDTSVILLAKTIRSNF
jgi:hypothetical protein